MKRQLPLAIALVALALLLTGCFGYLPVRGTGITNIGGPIDLEMWASSGCVAAGETIKLRATVTNNTNRTHIFDAPDQPVLDIWIVAPTGPIRWSDGKAMTPALTHLELQPGESKSIEMDWSTQGLKWAGPVGVEAQFIDSPRAQTPATASVLVQVGVCVGAFGP